MKKKVSAITKKRAIDPPQRALGGINHISLDETKFRARRIMDRARKIRAEFSGLESEFLAMAQIKDSGGSDPENFALVAELYGVGGADQTAKNAKAKQLFDELNSTLGNSAALIQFMSLLGA